jgi:hypothetical protein
MTEQKENGPSLEELRASLREKGIDMDNLDDFGVLWAAMGQNLNTAMHGDWEDPEFLRLLEGAITPWVNVFTVLLKLVREERAELV